MNRKFGFKNMHHGAAGRSFRNQTGDVDVAQFYDLGRIAAQEAFAQGGVNALLSFLAGYNAQDYAYEGLDALQDQLGSTNTTIV